MLRVKNSLFAIYVALFIASCSSIDVDKSNVLPDACTSQCVAPYGEVLGVGLGNVPAYSNCNANCVVFSPNLATGTYTGIKWQCVEYARRWLLVNKGVVYGDVDIAADIWALDYVTRVKDKTKLMMSSYVNGNETKPEVGDLLIYAKAYLKTGHVAVVSKIDSESHTIQVVEQNFKNEKWPDGYARRIPYIEQDKKLWLLDSYLLGWKRVTDQPTNMAHVNK